MMRAQIIKELRENARWGLLAAVALSGMVVFLLSAGSTRGMSLVGDTYLTTMMLAFGNAGLTLGLLPVGELRRGRWDFAAHRPASRWHLFGGKAIAIAALYLAATTVSVLVAALCAASPRLVRAPFSISMLQPTIFYQLAGLLWLACGMTIAARRARWIGTRFFPAAFAGVSYSLAYALSFHWYLSVVVLITATVLLLISAGAYFVHNGDYEPQALAARAVSAVVVSGGPVTALICVVGFTIEGLRLFSSPPTTWPENYAVYLLDHAGSPYREAVINGDRVMQDVDGRPMSAAERGRRLGPGDPGGKQLVIANSAHRDSPLYSFSWDQSLLNPANHLQQLDRFSGRGINDPRWVYVVHDHRLEVVSAEGKLLGTLGGDGVLNPQRTSPPFPPGTRFDAYAGFGLGPLLVGPANAYWIDLRNSMARLIYVGDAADPLLTLGIYVPEVGTDLLESKEPNAALSRIKVLAATASGVHIVAADGHGPRLTIPYSAKSWHTTVIVAPIDDTSAAMLEGGQDFRGEPATVLTVHGDQLTREVLPILPMGGVLMYPTGWLGLLQRDLEFVLVPPAWAAGEVVLYRSRTPTVIYLPLIAITAIVAVAITLLLARRRGLNRSSKWTWIALSLLFGLYAPLTLLCVRKRPARIPCPACGKARRVNGDRCEHCGAAWPVPGNAATDVFEPQDRAAA